MKRSKFTDEQISYLVRQVEGGTAVADVCRPVGVGEANLLPRWLLIPGSRFLVDQVLEPIDWGRAAVIV